MDDVLVTIQCLTYNHVNYIRQCLNSFLMQKTKFKFEVFVHDDASTDGTTDIIREFSLNFPHIIKPLIEIENLYSKKDGSLMRKVNDSSNYKGKYIACCEGDDYWLDPLKLQKQIDYLEEHPECSLSASNGLVLWDGGYKRPTYFNNCFISRGYSIDELVEKWCFPTSSLVFRKDILERFPDWIYKIYSGDQTIILLSAYYGSIYCLGETTCVYRRSVTNVSSASFLVGSNMLFVQEQHLLLYKEFRVYSGDKFSSVLDKHINYIEKEIKYLRQKQNNRLYTYFRYPNRTIKELVRSIFYTIIGKEKTHILFH